MTIICESDMVAQTISKNVLFDGSGNSFRSPLITCSLEFNEIFDKLPDLYSKKSAMRHLVTDDWAHLILVDANQFGVIRGAEVEHTEETEGLDKAGRGYKHEYRAYDDVCDLDAHLLKISVQNTTGGCEVHPVEGDNCVGGEESVEDQSNHSGQPMLCEDIHGVVDVKEILD
jgi:hypothetical protein